MKPPLMNAPSQPSGQQAESIASATMQPKAFSHKMFAKVLCPLITYTTQHWPPEAAKKY